MSQPKLLECVRSAARLRHLSLSTEKAYSDRIRRYILFHNKRYPLEMGADEIRRFLTPGRLRSGRRLDAESGAVCSALPLPRSAER